MNKLLFAISFGFLYSVMVYGSSLSSYTLEHKASPVIAPKGMIQFILDSSPDELQLFNQCMAENSYPTSEFFIVSKANLTRNSTETYFVRPALEPYCMAFYGAHLFRYWFLKVESVDSKLNFTMLLQGGGDGIVVLASETKGHRDLSSISQTAMESYTTTLKYNGLTYEPTDCTVKNFSTEKVSPCE